MSNTTTIEKSLNIVVGKYDESVIALLDSSFIDHLEGLIADEINKADPDCATPKVYIIPK